MSRSTRAHIGTIAFAHALLIPAALGVTATVTSAQTAGETPTATERAAPSFQHPDSERAGQAYAAWIAKNWRPGSLSESEHRRAAEDLLATGNNADAAARRFAQALSADLESAPAWLGLARALLQTPPSQLQGSRRYTTPRNAAGAAMKAKTHATSDAERAAALAVLSEALQRRSMFRPAIDALKVSLALDARASTQAAYDDLRRAHGFRVLDYTVENEAATPRACVQFSEALRASADDYRPFVALDGNAPGRIQVSGQQLCVDGLDHGGTYTLRLREGLPAKIDEALIKTVDLGVFVKDRSPTLRFSGRNYILPKTGQNGIPVTSINAAAATVEIYRVGDRGLVRQVLDGMVGQDLGSWDAKTLRERTGQKVYDGRIALRVERNAEVTTAVPVRDVIPDLATGLYAMIARPAEVKTDDATPATQWFVVSDLGLTAISGNDGVHALVRSLETARPLAGVTVRLVANNNEVLAETKSDASGHIHFKHGIANGEGGMAPAVLVAESASAGYAFLDLSRGAFDLTDRGVTGRTPPGPIDAFLYTDRGIYRPGDTVNVTGLLRTSSGAASNLPATFIISRPDGVVFLKKAMADQGLGGRTLPIAVPADAMRGTWRIAVHLDPKAAPLTETAILVEDFLPERLALDVESEATAFRYGDTTPVSVTGRYLYGPPAADLAVEADVLITAKAGAETTGPHKGFHFGDAAKLVQPVRASLPDTGRTDAEGKAALLAKLPKLPKTARPLSAKLLVRLREPGGRTIERTLSRPVLAGLDRIGIKPGFDDLRLGDGERATFDVVTVDGTDMRTATPKLRWQIVRLERLWQWYRRNGVWSYDSAVIPRRVAGGEIATMADAAAKIASDLKPGRYRLEVASPDRDSALMAAKVTFNVGWYQTADADSPEVLDVALDKDSYKPGETAQVRIATTEGGRATVAVIGDGLKAIQVADVTSGTTTIPVAVSEDWGAGAYVTVALHRPMDVANRRMPSRAIGLAWLKMDAAHRTLSVALQAPERMRSARKLSVPVSVSGLEAGAEARVTVAAIDEGILSVTRFKTPDPTAHLFAQTQLSAEIRDVYGRLIDGMRAERGTLKSGGDAAGLNISTAPPIGRTVALFSGIKTVGTDGRVTVDFDIPEFNGAVRLMAVAWSAGRVGHAEAKVLVRDPVAVTLSTPRFLTMGDEARMTLAVHNVDAGAGAFRVAISTAMDGRPVAVAHTETLDLAAGARKAVTATLPTRGLGAQTIIATIEGPNGLTVKRELALDVLPAAENVRKTKRLTLAPGQSLTLNSGHLDGLLPGNATLAISAGRTARLDIAGVLASLDRYPYGCTEQTISRALPLLYANTLSQSVAGQSDTALKPRVAEAITRVFGRQDGSGGFGLWSAGGSDLWLTAYAGEFLSRAQSAGYDVPGEAHDRTLERLANTVAFAQSVEGDGAPLAYALYVLARAGRVPTGELRYYANTKLAAFKSPLAKAQIAAALALIGDTEPARRIFETLETEARQSADADDRRDFGSRLRDIAAVTALASEAGFAAIADRMVAPLADAYDDRAATSTQEQAWMVLAANALGGKPTGARLAGAGQDGKAIVRTTLDSTTLADGKSVLTNTGDTRLPVVLTAIGASATALPAASEGFELTRRYYRLDGTPVMPENGAIAVTQNERLVVVVSAVTRHNGGRVLLVDRLAAGLEIENPKLVEGGTLSGLAWLKTPLMPEHTEFRDDRFVAAFDAAKSTGANGDGGRTYTVAYMVRAVTPGTYLTPAAHIEDMYRPERFARTDTVRLSVTAGN
jgi:uncharacterized protein YfaS (alpha-2-macroglobulin family)